MGEASQTNSFKAAILEVFFPVKSADDAHGLAAKLTGLHLDIDAKAATDDRIQRRIANKRAYKKGSAVKLAKQLASKLNTNKQTVENTRRCIMLKHGIHFDEREKAWASKYDTCAYNE